MNKKSDCRAFLLWCVRGVFIMMICGVALLVSASAAALGQTFWDDSGAPNGGVPGPTPQNGAWVPMGAPPGPPPMDGMGVPMGPPPMDGMGAPMGLPPMNGMGAPMGPPPMDGMGAPPGPPPGNMAVTASFGPKKISADSFLWLAFYTVVLLSGLAFVSHYRRKKTCYTPALKTQIAASSRVPFRGEISSVPLKVTRSSRIPTSTGIFDQ